MASSEEKQSEAAGIKVVHFGAVSFVSGFDSYEER
jgi:hypothetical protein